MGVGLKTGTERLVREKRPSAIIKAILGTVKSNSIPEWPLRK